MSLAANVGGPTKVLPVTAAGKIPIVDDRTATAGGVRAVGLPYDRLITAQVRPVVVDLSTAALCIPVIPAIVKPIPAANVTSVVIARGTATTSPGAGGLGSDTASTADLGAVAVDGVTAAVGIATIRFVSQLSTTTTDVPVTIIHPAIAAAVRGVPVYANSR